VDDRIANLEKALAEALARSEAAESRLADQQQRLKALGTGREESMRALAEARDELRRTSLERDELRKHLARVDSVQTTTLALPDNEDSAPAATGTAAPAVLPSLDELMASLGEIQEPSTRVEGHLHQRVKLDTDDSEEMIPPALVFPEEYAATAKPADGADAPATRLLVLLDPERPIKYPLFKEVMTIGRADVADIQINNGFLSRLHARVVSTPEGVTIEDVESKNGIRVNTKLTHRQALRHGDTVDLGRLRFRFIDVASDDEA
ncbi:MAG TPA: FHA domain-containing protein, partial [Gammaproteobacteria bacterium]